jgi:uncharacterized membrane protein YdbT with pleckstrin-like domain
MPLSENEEKILADIEANIRRSDPDLAQHVEQTTIYRHSGRRILFSVLGLVALLIVIVISFTQTWWISFIAFGAMVAIGISLVDHVVKISKAGVDDVIRQSKRMVNKNKNR